MKMMKFYGLACLMILMLVTGCGDDEDLDTIPPEINFDTEQLTSKTYQLGERIQASIPVDTKGNFVIDVEARFCAIDPNGCTGLGDSLTVINSSEDFTYQLDYTIPDDSFFLKSGGQLQISLVPDLRDAEASPVIMRVVLDIE